MRRGVTLLETLTVIAIILVLAGLVFVFFKPSRIESYKIESRENLRQLYQAYVMYSNDHPGASTHPDLEPLVWGVTHRNILGHLMAYYGLEKGQTISPAAHLSPTKPLGYGAPILANPSECLETYGRDCVLWTDLEIDKILWPSEMDTDPYMLNKFEIQLLVSGEIRDVRKPGFRVTFETYQ
jgi:prepilin-type N-terminal cleavage/methylation domain-containing protein